MGQKGEKDLQTLVFWAMTPWSLVQGYQCFWRNCWLHQWIPAVQLATCAGLRNILTLKRAPRNSKNLGVTTVQIFCMWSLYHCSTKTHTYKKSASVH